MFHSSLGLQGKPSKYFIWVNAWNSTFENKFIRRLGFIAVYWLTLLAAQGIQVIVFVSLVIRTDWAEYARKVSQSLLINMCTLLFLYCVKNIAVLNYLANSSGKGRKTGAENTSDKHKEIPQIFSR